MIEVVDHHHANTLNACNICADPESFAGRGRKPIPVFLRKPIPSEMETVHQQDSSQF